MTDRIRIISMALSLGTFTTENIQKGTGIRPDVIGKELARLDTEGYVCTLAGSYCLTADCGKRMALVDELEQFYKLPEEKAEQFERQTQALIALLENDVSRATAVLQELSLDELRKLSFECLALGSLCLRLQDSCQNMYCNGEARKD